MKVQTIVSHKSGARLIPAVSGVVSNLDAWASPDGQWTVRGMKEVNGDMEPAGPGETPDCYSLYQADPASGLPQWVSDHPSIQNARAAIPHRHLAGARLTPVVSNEREAMRVTFYLFPASEGGDVIAALWDYQANPGMVMSYQHVGQHGEASRDLFAHATEHGMREVQPTSQAVKALFDELTRIGYDLTIVPGRVGLSSKPLTASAESDTDSGNEAQQGEFDDSAAKETSAHREPADDVAANDIWLTLSSDGDIYNRVTKNYILNLARKVAQGKYDAAKAPKLWLYWLAAAIDFGMRDRRASFYGQDWMKRISPATREAVAKMAAEHYEQEVMEKGAEMKGAKDSGKPWFHPAGASLTPATSAHPDQRDLPATAAALQALLTKHGFANLQAAGIEFSTPETLVKNDPWGEVMGLFFDVAAEYTKRGMGTPAAWEYRPGMGGAQVESEFNQEFFDTLSNEQLFKLGNFLHEAQAILDAQGFSY